MSTAELPEQSLVGHLMDLKKSVTNILGILVLGFAGCIYFSSEIFDIIRGPIAPYLSADGGLVFTAPIDKFMAHIKVSFLAGAIVTCPLWLFQVWKFIAPGLYQREKKMAIVFIASGTLLFLVGVLFVYKIVFPMAFQYLLTFGGEVDKPMITISEYLGFFVTTTLLFGLAFELPLIIVVMAMLGIVDEEFLKKKRKIAIMLIAVLAAIITPPDAISMLAMLIPLVLLYELSILVVRAIAKPKTI